MTASQPRCASDDQNGGDGSATGWGQRFLAEVHGLVDTAGGEVELLPSLLAQACVTVLGVAGASISLTGDLRVPLGSSDATADSAERLQTTLGEGPCLAATHSVEPVLMTTADLAMRWPLYLHELAAKTPFRAVASIPLHTAQVRHLGALDLYATDSATLVRLPLAQVASDIADPVAAALFDTTTGNDILVKVQPTGWLTNRSVTDRMTVWTAVGMLGQHGSLTSADALARLRAYAYSHDTTLDHTAAQLTTKRISLQHLTA